MNHHFERFDMQQKPMRQGLRPLAWAMSFPAVWKHRTRIHKINMEGLKPPYILLCNHNAFLDFKVTTAAVFPHRANYVVAIDGFTTPSGNGFKSREGLMRRAGCICKRKFTGDILLVRHLKRVIENGDIAVIYPEARYSLCGTTAVLPESIGKMCKLFKVPVVTLIMHGHHVNAPFWNLHERNVAPTESEMTQVFTAKELKDTHPQEINKRINDAFQYDDLAWQKARGIKTTYEKRGEGLHKVLYQCPHCGTEYRMTSKGSQLVCESCGKSWTMSEYGELSADTGETEFSHIPDWYEWERANVRREVEAGTYGITCPVRVESLPNANGYISLGAGTMTHDMDGFRVTVSGEYGDFEMVKPVSSLYSCHIEYEYLGKYGDCVDLNTLEDTWYTYPYDCLFSVTKMALATEELYTAHKRNLYQEEQVG